MPTESSREITLDAIPSMVSMLVKAVTMRKRPSGDPQFQPLIVRSNDAPVNRDKLAKYAAVCGFPVSELLPLTYPHIMAFPLHMQLMLEPEFPFTPVGAVHIRNRITQSRALTVADELDFEARFGDVVSVSKGYEIDIVTEVRVAGELVWEDLSVLLVRGKTSTGQAGPKKSREDEPRYTDLVQWQLSANQGRRYAAASGDYNPIHLYPLTAKMMGFKRHIMHGMWSKSRAVAHLAPPEHAGAMTADVAFKLPIYLPSTVTFLSTAADGEARFSMKDAAAEKPHLVGELMWAD